MAQPNGPLTQQQIEDLIDNIAQLDEVDSEIEKARRAGVDVADQAASAAQARKQLMQLKSVYAPSMPLKARPSRK